MEEKRILEKTQFCYFVQCERLQFSDSLSKNINNIESFVFVLLDTMYTTYCFKYCFLTYFLQIQFFFVPSEIAGDVMAAVPHTLLHTLFQYKFYVLNPSCFVARGIYPVIAFQDSIWYPLHWIGNRGIAGHEKLGTQSLIENLWIEVYHYLPLFVWTVSYWMPTHSFYPSIHACKGHNDTKLTENVPV